MSTVHQQKLELLQNSMLHISKLWERDGHQRWRWIMGSFSQIEKEFDELSLPELRNRLRDIYKRLKQEKQTA